MDAEKVEAELGRVFLRLRQIEAERAKLNEILQTLEAQRYEMAQMEEQSEDRPD